MQHHRHTVKITLRPADHPALQTLKASPTLRVMVLCAAEKDGQQDIAFPHQSEIKVNTGEIKANLRGLKNKPGSTRPVDITKELRCSPASYANTIEMTYALTTKAGGGFQVSCLNPNLSFTLITSLNDSLRRFCCGIMLIVRRSSI